MPLLHTISSKEKKYLQKLSMLNEEEYIKQSKIMQNLETLYPKAKIIIPQYSHYKERRKSKTKPDLLIKDGPVTIIIEVKKMLKPYYPSVNDIVSKGMFGEYYTWKYLEKKYNKSRLVEGLAIWILLPLSEYSITCQENISEAIEIIVDSGIHFLIFNHKTQEFEDKTNWLLK